MRRLYVIIICVFLGFGCEHSHKDALEHGNAYNARGFIHFENGNYREAYNQFSKAIHAFYLPSAKAIAHMNRGDVAMSEGYLSQARADYKKAISLVNEGYERKYRHVYYFRRRYQIEYNAKNKLRDVNELIRKQKITRFNYRG